MTDPNSKKSYTIGFMTYEHRFHSHFMPLFTEIHRQRPDVEKVVFFNGQYKENFNQDFRRSCLAEMSKYDHTYVHVSPVFRSFSHMVNTNVNLSTNENTLILSDDNVVSPSFLNDYENALQEQGGSFIINGSFAHFSLSREDIINVGYFDERFLGIGEEDGEWDFRYAKYHNVPDYVNQPFYDVAFPGHHCPTHGGMLSPLVKINSIMHHNESNTNECKNMEIVSGKYSAYNRKFIHSKLLVEEPDHVDGEYTREGTYVRKVQMKNGLQSGTPNFYPGQLNFWENGDKL